MRSEGGGLQIQPPGGMEDMDPAGVAKGYYDNCLAKGSDAIPGSKPGEYLMFTERQEVARTAEEQGEGKKKAKAKKKADVEKLGWGIGFKELIARAGIDVNDAEQMDGAELLL